MLDFYGTAEVGRIALECPAHQGLHVNADHIILELLEDYLGLNRGNEVAWSSQS